jgi:hypothetical protein
MSRTEDVVRVDLWLQWAEGIRTLRAWHVYRSDDWSARHRKDNPVGG